MIRHNVIMYDGEYAWEQFRCWIPRTVRGTKVDASGKVLVIDTFVWLERIERRINKEWLTSEIAHAYEYRLLENQKP